MSAAPCSSTPPWPALTLAEAHAQLTAPGATHELEHRVVAGVPLRVWKNALPTLRDLFVQARAAHGDKTFLVYEHERATFESFARAAVTVAHALSGAGIEKGDRVAIAMRNLPEWPACFYGALLAGAIATPLNAWWTGTELTYALVDAGAKIALVDAERYERMLGHLTECPALSAVWVSRSRGPLSAPHGALAVSRLEDRLGPVAAWASLPDLPLPGVALAPDDDATIFYTSGTTSHPKGALGTHRNSTTILMHGPFGIARNFLRRGEPVPAPDPSAPQRATLLAIPFFHTTGCQAVLNPALANGGKIVMMHRWDAEQALQIIERERITLAGGVPTIAWQIVEHPARDRYDLSSLESVSYGGAPAASELVRRIKEVFPGSVPGTGWGMSETSSTFTHHSAEDYVNRPESAGPALPVNDMKIADTEGRALPVGSIGELWVRGPSVVRGYWNHPDATAAAFVDGWLRTGDLARLDDEGFLYLVDRIKDIIIRGGENIYCIEVEDVLHQHPAVVDAGLVGIPHRTLGEQPAAVVCLKQDAHASEDELRAFVRERLAGFKVPVRIVFLSEPLPRNANGKIMKGELKKLFADETRLAPTHQPLP